MTQGTQSWCSVTPWRDGVGREVGGGFRMEGRHMYADGRFILMYDKNHHNIVIIPQLKLINLKNALLPRYTKIA